MKASLILLAGGSGQRMQTETPKQFLPLKNLPVALHSLQIFLKTEKFEQIVVVCAEKFRHFFEGFSVVFASPGLLRQDSVFNGLQKVDPDSEWVCVHDAARPFITEEMVHNLFEGGKTASSATLAMPVKYTLKEIGEGDFVARTLNRSHIWEIQTPQLIKKQILQKGFEHVHQNGLEVTDDVSIAELIGESVKLVTGSYKNIKLTTPEDLAFAEWMLQTNIS